MKGWTFGLLQGLTVKPGLYDTTPLYNYLVKNVKMPPVRNALVGTTSLNTGQYVLFNANRPIQEFIEAAMASSAIPGLFPPITIADDIFTDGGVTINSDPMTAIEECFEITGNEANIVIDMISCFNKKVDVDESNMQSLDVLSRARDIRGYHDDLKFLTWEIKAYTKVNFRYYLQPSKKLTLNTLLDFNSKRIKSTINIGYKDVVNAIKNNIYIDSVLPNLFDTVYI